MARQRIIDGAALAQPALRSLRYRRHPTIPCATGLWRRPSGFPKPSRADARALVGRRHRPARHRLAEHTVRDLVMLEIVIHPELPEQDHGVLLGLLAEALEPADEGLGAILGRADRAHQRLHD